MQQEEKGKDRYAGPWVLAQDNGEQVLKLHPLHLRDTWGRESQGLDGIGDTSRREGLVLCDQSAFSRLWLADMKFGAVERENCSAKEMHRILADGKLAERK